MVMSNVINIRDPIHGFITLNPIEQKIIKTFPFQRLRFIHQLGPSFFVYPTATHKRFEHSLGVFHLSTKILKKLKEEKTIPISEDDEQVFRLASLLHDIGHAPFSHVGEEMKLFEDKVNHEVMTSKVITETEIGKVIRESLGEDGLKRVIFIITAEGTPSKEIDLVFHELLTGQAGIDRMDYLLRDSYMLGVMYGKYDLERLLETMCFSEDDGLYWDEGGLHALEQFILARYFMFLEVYFHKTRRSLDYHVSQLIREFLSENLGIEHFPTDVDQFMKLDDYKILSWGLNKSDFRKVFIERKFFRKVAETSPHPRSEELVLWEWLHAELLKNFDKNHFFLDKAENAPYKFESPDIKVKVGSLILPIHERSQLVQNLRPLKKIRIFVDLKLRDPIKNFINNFFEERGKL